MDLLIHVGVIGHPICQRRNFRESIITTLLPRLANCQRCVMLQRVVSEAIVEEALGEDGIS